jgi:hypothetical protein
MKGFRVMNQPNFSRGEVLSNRGDDSHTKFAGGVIPSRSQLDSRSCSETQSPNREPSQRGCEIMTRCIDFRNTIAANSYAQSSNSTSNQKFPITTLVWPWLWAAVRKFKSDAVPSEIWLGVEYQKGRGLTRLSNGYLLVLIQSLVYDLWPLEFDSATKFLLWTALSDLRILKLWHHFKMATPKSLNTKFIDNPLIFLMNLVTPWCGTQNDDYGHHKTTGRHIAIEGRWKFYIHTMDQHHLMRGAITQIRWALHHTTEMTW